MVNTGLFQKANIRFPSFLPLLEPNETAASIISAQRKELHEASIPRMLFHGIRMFRVFPNDANTLVTDFLDCAPEINADN